MASLPPEPLFRLPFIGGVHYTHIFSALFGSGFTITSLRLAGWLTNRVESWMYVLFAVVSIIATHWVLFS